MTDWDDAYRAGQASRQEEISELQGELRSVDQVLDRRDALANCDNRIDKILLLLRLAATADPKAELVKALATLDTLTQELKTWRQWAQFVYTKSLPDADDQTLRAGVCEAHDRDTAKLADDLKSMTETKEAWRHDCNVELQARLVVEAKFEEAEAQRDQTKERLALRDIHDTWTPDVQEIEILRLRKAFESHTTAVADFLKELYAIMIMIDPLAEGTISVDDMKAALLQAAIRDRDQQA